MLGYKENGFFQNNLVLILKLLDIINAIIVIKHGCQLIQNDHSSKGAKVATDTSILPICGRIFTKRNMIISKRRLWRITRSHI
jgi:hypothetical protein